MYRNLTGSATHSLQAAAAILEQRSPMIQVRNERKSYRCLPDFAHALFIFRTHKGNFAHKKVTA